MMQKQLFPFREAEWQCHQGMWPVLVTLIPQRLLADQGACKARWEKLGEAGSASLPQAWDRTSPLLFPHHSDTVLGCPQVGLVTDVLFCYCEHSLLKVNERNG